MTRLHAADFPRLEELRREGVEVFATPAPETSGIANYYKSADMERRVCVPLGFAGPIQPADVPDVTRSIYAITPIIAGEVDLPLLKMLAARGPVALDVQGFVRVRVGDELLFRPWPEMAEGLRHVTYLKVDRAEAEALTGETDLAAAAAQAGRLRPAGDRAHRIRRGDRLRGRRRSISRPSPRAPWPAAPGRGDTCFATYLTKRLSSHPAEACRWAGAVTSQKQEQPGPWRGTAADVALFMPSRE